MISCLSLRFISSSGMLLVRSSIMCSSVVTAGCWGVMSTLVDPDIFRMIVLSGGAIAAVLRGSITRSLQGKLWMVSFRFYGSGFPLGLIGSGRSSAGMISTGGYLMSVTGCPIRIPGNRVGARNAERLSMLSWSGSMKITLEGERPWSWNQMYAGVHWSKRKEEADRVHDEVWLDCHVFKREMIIGVVDIHITAYFKNRPLDSDNICSKLYIDGLIGNVIEDDTREFVRRVSTQSEVDKENPRVEIEIITLEDLQ